MAPRSWLSGRWRRGGSGGRSTSARAALLPQGGWPTALAAVATAATAAAAAAAAAAVAAATRAQDAASLAPAAAAGLACTGILLCAGAGAGAPSGAQPCPLPPPRVGAGAAGSTITSRLRGSTQPGPVLGRMAGAGSPSGAQPCAVVPPPCPGAARPTTMPSRLRGSTQELGRMAGDDEMLDDGEGLHGRRARTQATPAGVSRGCMCMCMYSVSVCMGPGAPRHPVGAQAVTRRPVARVRPAALAFVIPLHHPRGHRRAACVDPDRVRNGATLRPR